MKLAVLNPGGNDPEQHFPDGAGAPDPRWHAPVNYHAFAACTSGGFFANASAIPADQREVLLLLRWDLPRCLKALRKLKPDGKTVAVSLKESGLHQVAELLLKPSKIACFREICAAADGAISATPELVEIYRAAGAKHCEFIPTPYPIDDPRWDFSVPTAERRGIFIGTREFEIPSRNHLAALLLAQRLGEKITVINVEDRPGRKRLAALQIADLEIIEGPLPYLDYLRLMARHRLVFQLDRGAVPGQVAGDALLCRVPCVGGDGAVERLAFPELCGHGRAFEETLASAGQILRSTPDQAVGGAIRRLSFGAVSEELSAFFARIASQR